MSGCVCRRQHGQQSHGIGGAVFPVRARAALLGQSLARQIDYESSKPCCSDSVNFGGVWLNHAIYFASLVAWFVSWKPDRHTLAAAVASWTHTAGCGFVGSDGDGPEPELKDCTVTLCVTDVSNHTSVQTEHGCHVLILRKALVSAGHVVFRC